jgi:phosphohistidine phosphatase SixA
LAAGIAPALLATALGRFIRTGNVMIVGHEPQLSELVSLVLTGAPDKLRLQLRKGGCAALEISRLPDRGGGELLWMLTPRQLRKVSK